MNKIIGLHGSYTASQIKAKSSIPQQTNMSVVGNTVECINISVSQIKSVLSASTNAVSQLCNHANINRYSFYSPLEWSDVNGLITFSPKYPYSLGNFAGYNHNASKPGIYSVVPSAINYGNGMKTTDVTVNVKLGEMDLTKNPYSRYIKAVVKDSGGVVRGSSITEIAQMFTLDGGIGVLDLTITYYNTANTTFYVYVYLCDYNGGAEVAFPDFSASTITGTWVDPASVTMSLSVSGLITSVSAGLTYTAPDQYAIEYMMVYTDDRVEFTGNINLSYTIYNASGVATGGDTINGSTTARDFYGTINGALGAGYYIIFNVTD